MCNMAFAYVLMLVVMTCNLGYFLAILWGSGLGYYVSTINSHSLTADSKDTGQSISAHACEGMVDDGPSPSDVNDEQV